MIVTESWNNLKRDIGFITKFTKKQGDTTQIGSAYTADARQPTDTAGARKPCLSGRRQKALPIQLAPGNLLHGRQQRISAYTAGGRQSAYPADARVSPSRSEDLGSFFVLQGNRFHLYKRMRTESVSMFQSFKSTRRVRLTKFLQHLASKDHSVQKDPFSVSVFVRDRDR